MKKAIALVCALSLCLLLSGCSGGALGGLTSVFGGSSNSPGASSSPGTSSNPGASNNPGASSDPGSSNSFSIDLSQGRYSKGDEDGYLGDVLHTRWFNFALESAYTCKTYGGYTAPDGWLLLVTRIGLKNTYGRSVDMFDDDFMLWWNDDADDAYAWPVTTKTDIDDDQVHVDAPLSDEMLPESYVLGINETRVGELIFQVPALDMDGRENRDFVINFVEVFDTDNEDERIGDSYYIDFTAESRSPVTPSVQPSSAPSAEPSPEPSAEPSPSASTSNVIRATDNHPYWNRLLSGTYTEGENDSGAIGDVFHTFWFNFMVDDAYFCPSYGGYTAPAGYQLLVARIFLMNTIDGKVPMNDQDFMLLWQGEDSVYMVYPLTTGEEVEGLQPHIDAPLSALQLPEYYDIPAGAAVGGELIFQVTDEYSDLSAFMMGFTEYFNNGEEGDSYVVSLALDAA